MPQDRVQWRGLVDMAMKLQASENREISWLKTNQNQPLNRKFQYYFQRGLYRTCVMLPLCFILLCHGLKRQEEKLANAQCKRHFSFMDDAYLLSWYTHCLEVERTAGSLQRGCQQEGTHSKVVCFVTGFLESSEYNVYVLFIKVCYEPYGQL